MTIATGNLTTAFRNPVEPCSPAAAEVGKGVQILDAQAEQMKLFQYVLELVGKHKKVLEELESIYQQQEEVKVSKLVFIDRTLVEILEMETQFCALTVEAFVEKKEKLRKIREELEKWHFNEYIDDSKLKSCLVEYANNALWELITSSRA